jgi:hypothetical protein
VLAAETMDEAAIFTIDAWCQRMLREHAFDSGSLFDEELVSDERALFEDAANDYWRQHVYPLNGHALKPLLAVWSDVDALKAAARELVRRAELLGPDCVDEEGRPNDMEALGAVIAGVERAQQGKLARLKEGWASARTRWKAGSRRSAKRNRSASTATRCARIRCRNGSRPCAPGPRSGAAHAGPRRHGLETPDPGRHHRRLRQGFRRGAGLLRAYRGAEGRRWTRSSRWRTRCCATPPAISRAAWST